MQKLIHDRILQISGLDVDVSQVDDKDFKDVIQRCLIDLPVSERDRLKPYFLINTKQVAIDQCNFFNSFEDLEVVSKDSASNSWIFTGGLGLGAKYSLVPYAFCALKMTFEPLKSELLNVDNSLQIERDIYRKVVNALILCGFTPHVVVYYGTLHCDQFQKSIKEARKSRKELKNALKNIVKQVNTLSLNVERMRAVVTEGLSTGKYQQYISEELDFQSQLIILFQVFYTMAVFAQVGLVHNDLHTGNVFIDLIEKPLRNRYLITDNDKKVFVYELESKYQARLYDFDRSEKISMFGDLTLETAIHNNRLLPGDACIRFGYCPVLNERSEVYAFCASAYEHNNPEPKNPDDPKLPPINAELNQFLEKIVPLELLKRPFRKPESVEDDIVVGETLSFKYRLCTCNEPNCATCTVIQNTPIKTPREILAMPEFDQFKVPAEPVGKVDDVFTWSMPSDSNNSKLAKWRAPSQAASLQQQ